MVFLFIGLISLIFGILFLSSSKTLRDIGKALNRPVIILDEKLYAFRVIIGLLLVVVAGWIISVAFNYPQLWLLHFVGILGLFFGLIYLFFPHWLGWLSKVSNKIVFSTDETVIGSRKIAGIILIIAAVYLFYSAYLANLK